MISPYARTCICMYVCVYTQWKYMKNIVIIIIMKKYHTSSNDNTDDDDDECSMMERTFVVLLFIMYWCVYIHTYIHTLAMNIFRRRCMCVRVHENVFLHNSYIYTCHIYIHIHYIHIYYGWFSKRTKLHKTNMAAIFAAILCSIFRNFHRKFIWKKCKKSHKLSHLLCLCMLTLEILFISMVLALMTLRTYSYTFCTWPTHIHLERKKSLFFYTLISRTK